MYLTPFFGQGVTDMLLTSTNGEHDAWGLWRIFVVLAVILLAGCASREQAARDAFAKSLTCPVERVTATKVDGVRWSDVQRRANPIPQPPPEVRSDPARLAMWNKQNDNLSSGFDHNYEGFHVTGCGHEVNYLCFCPFDAPTWKQAACTCDAPPVPLLPEAS